MLWYKAWLETRWRVLMLLFMTMLSLSQAHFKGNLKLGPSPLLLAMPVFWLLYPMMLAGSGVATEAPFRAIKGIQGSVFFTLSLPVSRLRLLAARVLFGMLEASTAIVVACCLAAIAFPEVRHGTTLADGFRYAATVLLCSPAVYGLSTFFATFLDQQFQILATAGTVFLLRLLAGGGWILFRAMGEASPLITHVMPWTAMGESLGIGLICFIAAAKVVQARQY